MRINLNCSKLNKKDTRQLHYIAMAIPQYRSTNFSVSNGTTQLVRSRNSSGSSSSDSYSRSDAIHEMIYRVPRSHRIQRNLSPTSSQTSTDGQRNWRLQGHCNKCHQVRMQRSNHNNNQRYSMPSSTHHQISESKFNLIVPMTMANGRQYGSSIERRCRRKNRG